MSGQYNYKVQNMKTKEYQLAELIEVTRGTSLKGEYYSTSGKYKRMTLGNFDYNNNAFKEDKQKDNIYYIGNFDEKFILNEGDIVTPLTEQAIGLLGSTAFIPQSDVYIHSQDIGLIIPNKNIDKNFCYYLISSDFVKKQISSMAQQTKIRHTSPNKIKQCKVIIPDDFKYQKTVGEILRKIDIKIDLNNNMILKLESMMKDIYDYWFVQFDFPNEKGKPYKSSGGKMVYNEKLKREIPAIFEIKTVEDFCEIFTGKKDVNKSLDNGKYKFFSCAPEFRYSNEYLYDGKAILVSGNGSYTGRTIFVNDKFDLYQRTYAIVNKDDTQDIIEYIYLSLKTYFVLKVKGGTHGSAIPYIVYNDIANEPILYNKEMIMKFIDIVKQLLQKIVAIKNQNDKLKEYKNFILPLLMNGQVEIK